jgi:hypothetical protein
MNSPSLNVPVPQVPVSPESATLESAVRSAKELSRQLADIPASAPEARHPNYGVARALALTLIDMLDEVSRDTRGDGVRRRPGAR